MRKEYNFFALFTGFIAESKSGKRIKMDGTRIRPGTIKHYEVVNTELKHFVAQTGFVLRIQAITRMNSREVKSECLYWKKFYKKYSEYLHSNGSYDNYVGSHFKVLRTFFNYIKKEKNIYSGDGYKNFYVRTENIPITVLSPDQLQFLIKDREFEASLPAHLKRTKDIFVFGCTVALRFSDLMKLTNRNLEKSGEFTYLKTRSIKTSTDTRVKLPQYVLDLLEKYKGSANLLPKISNNQMNVNIKELCYRAGWTYEIGKEREQKGISKPIFPTKMGKIKIEVFRFCDLITTHTMRRTAITTMLSLGMPEIMVRNISGHSANSKEFYKYVQYAQQFVDSEIDKIHKALLNF